MLTTSKAVRYIGAIAALILISLLSSVNGLSLQHSISNFGDGFLWGVADPVLHFDSLVNTLAIGYIASGMMQAAFITGSLIVATVLGGLMSLSHMNLPGAEIAIAVASLVLSILLVTPNRPHWFILAVLGAIAGLSLGYLDSQSIIQVGGISQFTYLLGMVLSLYAVVTSAKKIGQAMNQETMSSVYRFVGLAILGISIVCLGNVIG
ncbi:HupE/UreJ family protein [Nostoc sp. TCL26-01]|uniref:HupE/UreJ family protein n=1 Tax=Nostoc sp. TCL26-01 TaxID=2576904 RepID=UPI0015B82F73|nr:HupE/UreJ family protein [Nostoc sp. TCL26-01]QLE55969.1 hydantoin utilization protein [Nostoc sp. TCL26-01]